MENDDNNDTKVAIYIFSLISIFPLLMLINYFWKTYPAGQLWSSLIMFVYIALYVIWAIKWFLK